MPPPFATALVRANLPEWCAGVEINTMEELERAVSRLKIGLIDVDGHRYPNLAIMKLSAWHKNTRSSVWWSDLIHYDAVYMSKVFSAEYTQDRPEPLNADRIIKGGTGYAISMENGKERYCKAMEGDLPEEVEHIRPTIPYTRNLQKIPHTGF